MVCFTFTILLLPTSLLILHNFTLAFGKTKEETKPLVQSQDNLYDDFLFAYINKSLTTTHQSITQNYIINQKNKNILHKRNKHNKRCFKHNNKNYKNKRKNITNEIVVNTIGSNKIGANKMKLNAHKMMLSNEKIRLNNSEKKINGDKMLIDEGTSNITTFKCPECNKIHCDKTVGECKNGWTTGFCGCCWVCARGIGERCGGMGSYLGECGEGLVCVPNQSNGGDGAGYKGDFIGGRENNFNDEAILNRNYKNIDYFDDYGFGIYKRYNGVLVDADKNYIRKNNYDNEERKSFDNYNSIEYYRGKRIGKQFDYESVLQNGKKELGIYDDRMNKKNELKKVWDSDEDVNNNGSDWSIKVRRNKLRRNVRNNQSGANHFTKHTSHFFKDKHEIDIFDEKADNNYKVDEKVDYFKEENKMNNKHISDNIIKNNDKKYKSNKIQINVSQSDKGFGTNGPQNHYRNIKVNPLKNKYNKSKRTKNVLSRNKMFGNESSSYKYIKDRSYNMLISNVKDDYKSNIKNIKKLNYKSKYTKKKNIKRKMKERIYRNRGTNNVLGRYNGSADDNLLKNRNKIKQKNNIKKIYNKNENRKSSKRIKEQRKNNNTYLNKKKTNILITKTILSNIKNKKSNDKKNVNKKNINPNNNIFEKYTRNDNHTNNIRNYKYHTKDKKWIYNKFSSEGVCSPGQ